MNNNIIIILVETIDSANIGAVARGMYNFGFDELRLVNTSDHKSKRAIDLACNAGKVLDNAKTYKSFGSAVADCTYIVGFTRRVGSHRIPKLWEKVAPNVFARSKRRDKIALVFGREDKGLSAKETDLCNELSIVNTSKNCPSINLAQAVTVALYELSKHKKTELDLPHEFIASANQIVKNVRDIDDFLTKIGYKDNELKTNILIRIKNILFRAGVTSADSKMLDGIIGQFKKSFTHKKS